MASRFFTPLTLSAALLGLIGCAPPPGRLIVLVESDMPSLTHVNVSTARLAGGGQETRGFSIGTGAGEFQFPFSFAVEPNGHPDDGVEIRVEGYDRLDPIRPTPVVSRTVRTPFIAGTTRLVRIALKETCRDTLCVASMTTCEAGRCETIPFLGLADLRVLLHEGDELRDGGVVDASVTDMSFDAPAPPDGGLDLDVPDLDGGRDLGVPDLDAAGPDDAGVDAPMSDAGSCTPTVEICDGMDNNCNVTIDDGATCPAGPIGAICAGGTCGCPAGRWDCAGTCNVTGTVCGSGDPACGGVGTTVCSGTTTTCSATPRTSGRCGVAGEACGASAMDICTCNTSGVCVYAYVDLCLDPGYVNCTPFPGFVDPRLAIPNLGTTSNRISSVRLVNITSVVLYDFNDYMPVSTSVTLTADCPNLATCVAGGFDDRAASVQINP